MNKTIIISNTSVGALPQDGSRRTAVPPVPAGYESAEPLPQAGGGLSTADQCRAMGLKCGDTIVGRESGRDGAWFNDAKLTLLFLGEKVAVWRQMKRNHENPRWKDEGESASWTLAARRWYLAPARQS